MQGLELPTHSPTSAVTMAKSSFTRGTRHPLLPGSQDPGFAPPLGTTFLFFSFHVRRDCSGEGKEPDQDGPGCEGGRGVSGFLAPPNTCWGLLQPAGF